MLLFFSFFISCYNRRPDILIIILILLWLLSRVWYFDVAAGVERFKFVLVLSVDLSLTWTVIALLNGGHYFLNSRPRRYGSQLSFYFWQVGSIVWRSIEWRKNFLIRVLRSCSWTHLSPKIVWARHHTVSHVSFNRLR